MKIEIDGQRKVVLDCLELKRYIENMKSKFSVLNLNADSVDENTKLIPYLSRANGEVVRTIDGLLMDALDLNEPAPEQEVLEDEFVEESVSESVDDEPIDDESVDVDLTEEVEEPVKVAKPEKKVAPAKVIEPSKPKVDDDTITL